MIEVTFPYYCGNLEEAFITHSLTQEQYDLLCEWAAKNEDFFEDNDELAELYQEIYEEAVEQATADMLEYDEEFAEEYGDIDGFRIDSVWNLRVEYPEELLGDDADYEDDDADYE